MHTLEYRVRLLGAVARERCTVCRRRYRYYYIHIYTHTSTTCTCMYGKATRC